MKEKFPPNALCVVCIHVFNRQRPVLYVARDHDEPPQFMCGLDDHFGPNDGRIVAFDSLPELDQTMINFTRIEEGEEMTRMDTNSGWLHSKKQENR